MDSLQHLYHNHKLYDLGHILLFFNLYGYVNLNGFPSTNPIIDTIIIAIKDAMNINKKSKSNLIFFLPVHFLFLRGPNSNSFEGGSPCYGTIS